MSACPNCSSEIVVKNGHIAGGKQNWKCRDCGRQFVEDPQHKRVSVETIELIEKLLLERISLAGISRVTGVSESWIQVFVNKKICIRIA